MRLPAGARAAAAAKPKVKFVEGSIEFEGELRFNESTNMDTAPLRISSGKRPFSDEAYKDELIGVIVRVFEPGGKMVFEHRDTKTKDFVWKQADGEGTFGISQERGGFVLPADATVNTTGENI